MHQEFINFLATQSITAKEWQDIKEKKPAVPNKNLMSLVIWVWEGVLKQTRFLENISPQQLFLFKVGENGMELIAVKVLKDGVDITSSEGFSWLQENFASDEVEFFTANKEFSEDKNADVFGLIQQGATITKGELYSFFEGMLK